MMKNAGYILFMQFDYITARKMQVQTRMKTRTLQWRICLMRHAPAPLNEQPSSREQCSVPQGGLSLAGSMLAVGSGPRGSDRIVIAPSSCWDMAFPSPVCDVRCLHFTPAPRLGPHPVPAPSPGSLIQQVETLM